MKITTSEFYSKVAKIISDYTSTDLSFDEATSKLDELNEFAQENRLKVSVDLNVLNTVKKDETPDESGSYEVESDDDESDDDDDDSYSYSYSY